MADARTCMTCGCAFTAYPSDPQRFCGRPCWAKRPQPTVKLTCGECAQAFVRPKGRSVGVKFCSKECLGAANGKRLAGPRERVVQPCAVCETQITMIPAVVGRKKFCSRRCNGIALLMRSSRPRSSQIGDAAILAWAERHGGDLDWQPELRVSRWTIDLAFPALMLAVELDGVYWHSRPGMKEKDQIRDAVLRGRGWDVRRIPIEQGATPQELAAAIAEVVSEHASRKAFA